MKKLMLMTMIAMTTLALQAQAATRCSLGESTADIEGAPGYKVLVTVNPLKGDLRGDEMESIVAAVQSSERKELLNAEAWGLFVDGPHFSCGGQIEYFTANGNVYARVTYYPGDNEYGVITRLTPKSLDKKGIRDAKAKVIAIVNDGDLLDCQE